MEFRLKIASTIVVLLTACVSTTPKSSDLAASIDAAIHRPPFQHAFWSILVEEDDGRVLYARNADKLTIPASNRKLFTSATVAECFGIDGQLFTEIWRDGEDLVIRGDGDFEALAETLRARNITRVHDVIVALSPP